MTRARDLADSADKDITGTLVVDGLTVDGNIAVTGTVDGADIAANNTKLAGIEASATADQTAAEIRTLVESASDSNVFTDADHTKLNSIETSADVTDATNVSAAGALMTTGGAMTGNLTFGDGSYAAFGNGLDLQIQHNGNNSFITDAGNGDLYIRGNNNLFVQNLDGSKNKAQFITDGAVNLMHDGTTRISTSSTGVDITGVVKANGHTSSAPSVFEASGNGDQVGVQLKVKANNGSTSTQGLYGNAGSTSAGNTIVLGNSGSSGLLVDSNGNVGIGTTSPSNFGGTTLQTNHGSTYSANLVSSGTHVLQMIASQTHNAMSIGARSNHHVAFTTNDTERMRIDASGRVMLGTTVPSLFNAEGTDAKLTVAGSDTSTTTIGNGGAAINIVQTNGGAGNTAGLHFSRQDTDGTPNYSGAAIVAQFTDDQATGEYPKARLVFNTSTNANAAPSEKMRIETNGCLRLGTASDEGFNNGQGTIIMKCSGGDALNINHTVNGNHVVNIKQSGSSTANFFFFFKNGNQVGRIQCSTSATSYDSLSDVRTKENIEDMTNAIDRVKQLKPKRFNFIVNPDETVDGFLAHEVTSVCPHSVSGTPDDVDDNGDPVYQTMDVAKLVPLLTGALQEALTKIETLETKVAALEAE